MDSKKSLTDSLVLQVLVIVVLPITLVGIIGLLYNYDSTHLSYTRTNIVHDYVFENGVKECKSHGGLYYVVTKTDIKEIGPNEDYPCKETIKFRCQDHTLISFDTGVGYCFIQEGQLKESL